MSQTREEIYSLNKKYRQAIQEFLKGGIDELFSFVQSNPVLVTNEYISGKARDMLRMALYQQQADAEAYRALVQLARDAGVPLFNPSRSSVTVNIKAPK